MPNVRTVSLRSQRQTSRREEETREMKIRCVPVTKYDVSRVYMPVGCSSRGWLDERAFRTWRYTTTQRENRWGIHKRKKVNIVICFHFVKRRCFVYLHFPNRNTGELYTYLRKRGFHVMPRALRKVDYKPKHPGPIRKLWERGRTHSWGLWIIHNEN